jgi:hypothetical protein
MKNKSVRAQVENLGPLTQRKNLPSAGRLTPTRVFGLLALATCLLARPALGSLQNPVTRPLHVVAGHLTLTVNPATGAYEFTGSGNATHTGLAATYGSGVLDLATGQFLSGTGLVIAANGDTLSWIVGDPNTVVYTGGTGRFQGVTGGFLVIPISQTLLSVNPDGTLTLAIDYEGSGTVTY